MIETELPALKLELQACSPIKKIDARAKCYEAVAVRAVGMIERIPAKPVKTEEKIKAEAEAQSKKEQDDKYQAFITEAKAALVINFKDLCSAQWRGLFISSLDPGSEVSPRFLCGEVTAKNSYGAYIGFRRFVAIGKGRIVEDKDNIDAFDLEWSTACHNPYIYKRPAR